MTLDITWLRSVLVTRLVGSEIHYLDEVDSTMTVAAAYAAAGAPEGTVVLTEKQTAGRGRFDRRWEAPAGSSLLLTILLTPLDGEVADLPMIAALAVADAVEGETDLAVRFKWPNDVLVNGKKCCGILVEARTFASTPRALIGIGLNVNLDPVMLPADATSLSHEAGEPIDRDSLLATLLTAIDRRISSRRFGVRPLAAWRDRLDTLNQPVTVTVGDRRISGLAIAVDDDGRLVVLRLDGSRERFAAGDVTLRA